MNDKEYIMDILESEKNLSVNMTYALNEASCDKLYKSYLKMFENINKKDEYRIRDDLAKGIASLKAGLEEPATELAIDGVLHRFEFTFELAWKTIKDYLEYIGIVEKTGSLREAIKNSI